MRRREELPELLAPAGSFDALVAAIDAGADAVYFGGGAFHARAMAKNFDGDEMARALLYCRLHGVRSYVTLNTLLHDRELPEALAFARTLRDGGADAVISADTGLISLLRRELPDLPVHASTQACIHGTPGADAMAEMGVERVVLARELSREDIARATEKALPEVEIFLHGALCVCQSGQCLFSSVVGGRSGNRGLCAQPCRLPYGNGYPLSLRDLCLADHVPDLIEGGVSSLKIEGRMKSPAYVYYTTSVYRRLLDERRAATAEERAFLAEIFCRGDGFTDGYYRGRTDVGMTGVRSDEQKRASRELLPPDVTPKKVPIQAKIVWRSENPFEITLIWRDVSATVTGDVPQVAKNAPIRPDDLRARVGKLGDTYFLLSDAEIDAQEGLFLPAGQINALRRAAVDALEKAIVSDALRRRANAAPAFPADLSVSPAPTEEAGVRRAVFYRPEVMAGLGAETLAYFDETVVPLETVGACPVTPWGVLMPPAVFDSQLPEVEEMLRAAAVRGVRHALVCGHGQDVTVRAAGLVPVGSYRLNITNRASAGVWAARGVSDLTLSPELTLPQIRDLGGRVIVYGRLPLMTLERCVTREISSCSRCGSAVLTDRTGAKFPILRTYPHRNIVLNSLPTYMCDKPDELSAAGVLHTSFLFTTETPAEITAVVTCARAAAPLNVPVRRIPRESR